MRQPVEMRQPAAMQVYFAFFGLAWVGLLLRSITSSPRSDAPIALLMIIVPGASDGTKSKTSGWAGGMAMPFGQVIHVLLRNGEVVTLDITASHWSFLLGGKGKRERMVQTLREWLPPQD